MDARRTSEVIREGASKPEVLVSNDYIEAQIGFDRLVDLAVQMGPSCNRQCAHCYGFFGPKRRGLPKREIVEKAVNETAAANIWKVNLTDGEPFRHENREVMRAVARASRNFYFSIMTNAVFARTQANATNWINFMKENGWNFKEGESGMQVSFGTSYHVEPMNYYRLNCALRDSFPGTDWGACLAYADLSTDAVGEKKLVDHVAACIHNAFAYEKRLDIGYCWFNRGAGLYCCTVGVGTKTPIPIIKDVCDPDGRAVGSFRKFFDEHTPIREFKLEEITFSPDSYYSLWMGHDGNIAFGPSASCAKRGRVYGNVMTDSLSQIKERMNSDPVFIAFKLGGARFMTYLARQINPKFNMFARIKCGLCQRVFGDKGLVERIRHNLGDDTIGIYLAYAEKTGLVESQRRYLEAQGS